MGSHRWQVGRLPGRLVVRAPAGREWLILAPYQWRTVPGMNPVVEAAWIAGVSGLVGVIVGVAGTVTVALVGFRSTAVNIAAQINAERWAAVYAEALGFVHYRQNRRSHDLRLRSLDPEIEVRAQEYLNSYTPPNSSVLEARLHAFGTAKVIDLMQASTRAHVAALEKFSDWEDGGGTPDPSGYRAARDAANDTDNQVVKQIRTELQGKEEATLPEGIDMMPPDVD